MITPTTYVPVDAAAQARSAAASAAVRADGPALLDEIRAALPADRVQAQIGALYARQVLHGEALALLLDQALS